MTFSNKFVVFLSSTDEPTGSSSKGTDSGIGGTESGEDGWISDVEVRKYSNFVRK